ncbi:peptidase A24 [Methanoplanus sp. FWC-SCC4]|uniref:Peptidase A24 n=1 Tax=Methanochimaera problematica TaxID=2609417 RepID=A0AA97FB96_9EURY|nr:A24 family peptidase C-terminal domain-containing protein [Methanoplanus sp. FWC-SCC4]WOF15789.1 peptidase A24 [Methanoplanus sp. FWC-SCC4]
MIEPLVISSIVITVTLLYASYRDVKERRVPFRTWYPMIAICVPISVWAYSLLIVSDLRFAFGYILMVVVFCSMFYFSSAYLHLFGGADAWALIFITAFVPLFPVEPLWSYPVLPFLPLTVLVNAVVLNLATPIGLLVFNIMKKNYAPLRYMFVGYPVDGKRITEYFGFIMEDFEDSEGELKRHYISFADAIKRMISGKRRMYTKDLKKDPEEYKVEIEMYRRAGHVWISYGVPFIIPIAAGFITAILFGDIVYVVMRTLGLF